jgi:hypothetical protein
LAVVKYDVVDGVFTDDILGLYQNCDFLRIYKKFIKAFDEHPDAAKNMNLTDAEVQDIKISAGKAGQKVINTLIKLGKYNWQAFGAYDWVGPGPTKQNCVQFMRTYCQKVLIPNLGCLFV